MATFGLGTSRRSSPGQRRLDAAVEEVRDVGVLLGLGDVELAPAGLASAWARERAVSGGNATSTGRPASYSVIVTTSEVARARAAVGGRGRSRRTLAVGQRVGQLAGPIGPEVRVDDRLAVADAPSTPSMTVGATNSSVSPRAYAASIAAVGRWRPCRPTPWTIAS